MSRNVNKLFDIEIDEVSVVDRPANQHGLITFSKSAGAGEGRMIHKEDSMPENEIFDADGVAVEVDELQHGDVVYDANGAEYVFVEDDDADDVEKGFAYKPAKEAARAFASAPHIAASDMMAGVGPAARRARSAASRRMADADLKGKGRRALNQAMYNGPRVAGNAALVGGGGALGGYAYEKTSKSLGDAVLEELSKAVSDADREAIIAKALNEVEIAKAAAEEAWAYADAERDMRLTEEFISKAADYNLPVAPEVFGPILKSLAEVLDDADLQVLDEIFTAVGDALYNEVGYVGGGSNSSVLDTVSGLAAEMVGKSNLSYEQSLTAMFEANPAAYDAYLSENGR